jgi:hypothetical protein
MTLINPPKQVCGAKTRQGGSCREVPSEGKKRVADCMAAPKGQARPLASATAGSDTGGTARKRGRIASLKPRNAEQRPTNGKKRFQPGTGTLPAPRSSGALRNEHRDRQHQPAARRKVILQMNRKRKLQRSARLANVAVA